MANRRHTVGKRAFASVSREFWSEVNGRLVRVHKVSPITAGRAVSTYKRRVGDVALNQGPVETAHDIATVVREGGFVKVKASAMTGRTQLPKIVIKSKVK